MLEQYVAAVRDAVGMEIPLFDGPLGASWRGSRSFGLGKAYEKYNLSWMEDVIPWTYTDLLKQIADESPTPISHRRRYFYLKEPFRVLCECHAVGKTLTRTSPLLGGSWNFTKIGDMAEEYGVPMAMHFAGTPVSCMANVTAPAAHAKISSPSKNHSLDVPWWSNRFKKS